MQAKKKREMIGQENFTIPKAPSVASSKSCMRAPRECGKWKKSVSRVFFTLSVLLVATEPVASCANVFGPVSRLFFMPLVALDAPVPFAKLF